MIARSLLRLKYKTIDINSEKFVTRGGFDIGTSGRITWTIASIYPRRAIMRKQIFHNSLDLPPQGIMIRENIITPQGVTALENSFFEIFGRMDEARIRPREMAAIVCEPFSKASNAAEVFGSLSKRFMIHFELVDAVKMEHYAHIAYIVAAGISMRMAQHVIAWTEIDDRVVFFRRKLERSEKEEMTPQVSLSSDVSEDKTDIWDSKYTAQEVHDLILESYQNRSIIEQKLPGGPIQSVNPMSAKEILVAVDDMTKAFRMTMPDWLKEARKTTSASDRLFCGASPNGGTINILSRSCGRTDVDLYSARSNLYGPYVGVTDAFLSRSFPTPHLVLPRLITAHALLNALDLRMLRYLPEISPSFGVLVDENLYSPQSDLEIRGEHHLPLYFDRPWKTISRNPHVGQHIEVPSDAMQFLHKRK